MMFSNYLKITLRNFKNQKGYTFINIMGFAIGLACCILITLYVVDEISFDKFNEHYDDIYRCNIKGRFAGEDLESTYTPAPLAFTMCTEIPEIIQTTRIQQAGTMQIKYGDNLFNEDGFCFTDSTIFKVFTFPLIAGDPKTALIDPHSVVLSEEMALKYFGNEDPLNKMLIMEDGTNYKITGVMKNIPKNSHVNFDFLGSLSSVEYSRNQVWVSNNLLTYFRLQSGSKFENIKDRFNKIVLDHVGPQIQAATGKSFEEFLKGGNSYGYYLEPMEDFYLKSKLSNSLGKKGNIQYVYTFSLVAIFILLIACVNFMNLSTAKSANRAKEVGIRKTMGSSRRTLILQFMIESVFLTLMSVFIAIIIVKIASPYFNDISGKDLHIALATANTWYYIPVLLILTVVVGILSGLYPAFYLSSFQPAKVLKGEIQTAGANGKLRSILVIFQFAISVILIFSTLIVKNQLAFFQEKNLGFNKEQIVIIPRSDVIGDQFQAFKNELNQHPNIIASTFSTSIPGHANSNNAHMVEGSSTNDIFTMNCIWTDADFATTYELDIEWGRFISHERATDTLACVINSAAVEIAKWNKDEGKRMVEMDRTPEYYTYRNVVGVVKGFHITSLHDKLEPVVFNNAPGAKNFLSVKISTHDVNNTLSLIQDTWEKFAPGKIYNSYFFDEDYERLYRAEMQTGKIFTLFAGLAIIIACLGLFGLASFMAEKRTKEIGIRKTLGASIPNIMVLLIREFTKWVLISNLVAWPLGYYLMNKWLQNFAYRTDFSVMPFLLSGLFALIITLITVSWQTVKAATANPVKSIRYE